MALAGTRQVRLQRPVSVHAHCTKGVTRSEGWEEANGDGNGVKGGKGNRVGGGNEDGNGDGDGNRAGTGAGVEVRERTQDAPVCRQGVAFAGTR